MKSSQGGLIENVSISTHRNIQFQQITKNALVSVAIYDRQRYINNTLLIAKYLGYFMKAEDQ